LFAILLLTDKLFLRPKTLKAADFTKEKEELQEPTILLPGNSFGEATAFIGLFYFII
jgi:hypothetical protein